MAKRSNSNRAASATKAAAKTPGAASGSPSGRYLKLIEKRIGIIRHDIPVLTETGSRMAEPMLAGGQFFLPSVAPFWPGEFCSRAGGLMGLARGVGPDWLRHEPGSRDISYIALPDPRWWKPREDENLQRLLAGKGHIFVNGRSDELESLSAAQQKRIAGFTGGAAVDEGLYGIENRRPLAGVRHFDQYVRGWMTAGEFIAACTRAGRMPTVYMSVWLEGALVRNASFMEHHNLSEPWPVPFFHKDIYIPPLAEGRVSGEFLDIAAGHLATLQQQLPQLAKAGAWMAEAKSSGRRVWVVAVGHSYPRILELPEDGSYPVEWGRSFSDLKKAIPHDIKAGDVVLHMGYAPVNVTTIRSILKRGIRLIHTSPYGRPASLEDHDNFMWLDLPWRPADASVDVPGYSVRILPMSSTCHTMAYFAILSELAELMGWK